MDHIEGMDDQPERLDGLRRLPFSSAFDIMQREPSTGALTQGDDGNGCITVEAVSGCARATSSQVSTRWSSHPKAATSTRPR